LPVRGATGAANDVGVVSDIRRQWQLKEG